MDFFRQIKINIFYDEELCKITKKASESAFVSENLPFVHFLNFIFTSYPKIQSKYSPGTIGFLINGAVPKVFDLMKDGDKLEIIYFKQIQ